jgi:hypothetical protein
VSYDDVQHDRVVRGVEVVPVLMPAPRFQMHLHGTASEFPVMEEDQGVREIGAQSVRPRSAVDYTYRFPLDGDEILGYLATVPRSAEENL